jgi:hypothetical protein
MEEIAAITMSLLRDRQILKWRVNLVKGGKVFGFLKPVREGFGTNL